MYKVLIIDDEAKVRRGLRQLIPTIDPEWTVIGQAKNGLEGLQMVKDHLPDLVITDIRMPRMNGLDLLNNLRSYSVYVVVLSGYGYFEYAQTAIKFGAFDFLLKPVKSEEISDVLSRVKKLIETQSSMIQRSLQKDYTSLWKEWLLEYVDPLEPPVQLTELFPEDGSSYHVLLIEIDNLDELVTEDQWGDRQLVMFATRNIISDVVQNEEGIVVTYMLSQGAQLLYLVQACRSIRVFSSNIIEEVRQWIKISVSIGVSDPHSTIYNIREAWQQARQTIQNKWIFGFGSVCEFADIRIEDALYNGYPISLEESLINAVKNCRIETALNLLDEFRNVITVNQMTFRLVHRFYLQLASSIIHILYEYKIYDIVLKDYGQPYELLEMNVPIIDLNTRLKLLIRTTVEAIEWTKTQKNERTMEKAMEYIHQNYRKDISLEDVSKSVQMSTSYFSTFFKQEKGISFVEYLTRVRVEKSKQLMADTIMKIYEISELVGYQDVKYFSRVFKRVIGVTPAEYREFFFRKEVE